MARWNTRAAVYVAGAGSWALAALPVQDPEQSRAHQISAAWFAVFTMLGLVAWLVGSPPPVKRMKTEPCPSASLQAMGFGHLATGAHAKEYAALRAALTELMST